MYGWRDSNSHATRACGPKPHVSTNSTTSANVFPYFISTLPRTTKVSIASISGELHHDSAGKASSI